MSKPPKITVRYSDAASVNIYNDGLAVVHTSHKKGPTVQKFITVCGGPVAMDTLLALELKAVLGPCTVTISGGEAKTLNSGGKLKVPEGASFTLKADAAVLTCTVKAGPGLGKPIGGQRP